LKEKIATLLIEQNKKILVIIDDIDRLNSEEIRQIFRVIKAVADFPNIIYLLAFDKTVAVEALKSTQGISGEDYLEKIVQVPFELPIPDKYSLRNLLLKKINIILGETPIKLFDENYWWRIYLDGIEPFIDTPRDIVRLMNTLSVTYPLVKGDVNPVDFVAIETIRVFCPVIYDLIRKNEKMFITSTDVNERLFDKSTSAIEAYKKFHADALLMVQEENRGQIKKVLSYIFPKFAALQSTASIIDIPWVEAGCRRYFRICSAEMFHRYFRLAISEGDISDTEFRFLLGLGKDCDAFGNRLVELADQKTPDGTTRARIFLRRFDDYIETIPKSDVPSIVQALCNVGDDLCRPEDELPGILRIRNGFLIENAIIQLLYIYNDENKLKIRYEILLKAISEGKAVSINAELVEKLELQHSEDHDQQPSLKEEPLISKEHALALKKIAIEKIRGFAQSNTLLKIPEFVYVLKLWLNWDNEFLVKEWVMGIISSDEGLIVFIEKFLNKGSSSGLYRLDYKGLALFIDVPQIMGRIQNLKGKEGLIETQEIAINQLIDEFRIIEHMNESDTINIK
jgi:predicted KAP-like P-loop ATPase